jgi:5-methylcytosine-specific restriction protein A
MPSKPLKPCGIPTCAGRALEGQRYCLDHSKAKRQEYVQAYGKDLKNFYSSKAWRTLRAQKLARNPLCEMCDAKGNTTAAVMVHHKDEIATGGKKLPGLDELQSLCAACHNEEHLRGIVADQKRRK